MALPASLAERIAIFRENGRLYRHDNELFSETSWLAVLHGQGIAPKRQHPLAHLGKERVGDICCRFCMGRTNGKKPARAGQVAPAGRFQGTVPTACVDTRRAHLDEEAPLDETDIVKAHIDDEGSAG